jgi:Protein of unknown function (DUF2950)
MSTHRRPRGSGIPSLAVTYAAAAAIVLSPATLPAQTAAPPTSPPPTSSPPTSAPPTSAPQTFATAQQAVDALIAANRSNDVSALGHILGADASTLISSGDETQDKTDRARFVEAYETHHRLLATDAGKMTLLVGTKEWPLPIPLVRSNGAWSFDSPAGVKELLYRRIGSNELAAINVCRALYQAQRDYAATGHDGNPAGVYAQRFRSEPGTQNGLYWPVAEGEPESPAGPLVADAEAAGYEQGKRHPFHGYYFRILKAQGPNVRGGAKDYVVDGKMTGGFAILAYPVEYGASGIMTFLVSRYGTVFQKDLGDATAETARAMTAFDPDASWTRLPKAK